MSERSGTPPGSKDGGSQRSSAGSNGADKSAHREKGRWWANPAIIIPAVLTLLTLIGSTFFALYPRSPQPVNHLADCRQAHPHASGSAVDASKARLGATAQIEGCLWPPISGTNSSGFWTVGMTVYPIAGAYAAKRYDYVAVFTTSCQALALDWQYNDQLTVAHTRFTVETSQTVSGYNGNPVNLLAGGNVPAAVERAEGTHLIVLFNGRYVLYHVECTVLH